MALIHGDATDEAYAAAAGHRPSIGATKRTPASHARDVANEARNLILDKYLKGQREHGGELWRKRGIIDMAIEEAVDQIVYLLTLRDQLAAAGFTPGDISE